MAIKRLNHLRKRLMKDKQMKDVYDKAMQPVHKKYEI